MNKDKIIYIGRGTVFEVEVNNNGLIKQQCLLAEIYNKDEVFQVIVLNDRFAGCIEGYISKQFNDERGSLCTLEHLKNELNTRIYGEDLISFKFVNLISVKQKDVDNLKKYTKHIKFPFKGD